MRARTVWLGMVALVVAGAPARAQLPTAQPRSAAVPVAVASAPIADGRAHALTRQDVDAWLDGYMPFALRGGDIPGAVVTVVKDGQILTARGFGYADVAGRRPVDPERTLFRPGSVSKLVTWTAVMQQVEAGHIDLDRDVNAYLDIRVPPRAGKPVTMRQIMTHTAGFEESAKDLIAYGKPAPSLAAYIHRGVPARIFEAGRTPAYSNWATTLAGYIVQRVSGEPFEAYVERHIFTPLGMRSASFRQPLPAALAAQMATGYQKAGEPPLGFEIIAPAPAGSLSASGTDMARFMLAHLNGGAFGGGRILQPATAATMHDSPLGRVDPFSLLPPLNRMELGFFETNVNGREVIGHLGDTSAFHTSLHLFMREGVGLYVSFNSTGRDGAVGPLRNALFMDFADRYFPEPGSSVAGVDPRTSAEHARMMAGVWDVSRRSDTNFLALAAYASQAKVGVGAKGELLVPALVGANGRPRDWVEVAPFVWRDRAGHDRIAAKVVDGRVVRWSMDQLSPFEVFDRAPARRSSGWLTPAMGAALAVLLLTALSWPVLGAARRRYGGKMLLEGRAVRPYRATRLMAILVLVLAALWAAAFAKLLTDVSALAAVFDPVVMALQVAGAVVFVGGLLVAIWDLATRLRVGRRWTGRVWSAVVVAAMAVVLFFAVQMGLLAMTTAY